MNKLEAFLERTWDGLLSREPQKIQETYQQLDPESQRVVIDHLKKMASEEGWHPEQVLSARAALEAIHSMGQAK